MFLYGQVASRNEKDDARPDPFCICYIGNLFAAEFCSRCFFLASVSLSQCAIPINFDLSQSISSNKVAAKSLVEIEVVLLSLSL